MKRILISLLAVALMLPAQKIEYATPARDRVVRVQTALNHLTVIEVAEPVATVAVGSPQAFKVERRENRVFIQPLQEGVSTNLFIWTASTRLNYELVPAINDAGQMDFAIDYRQPERQAESQPKPAPAAKGSAVPIEMLLRGVPVKQVGFPRSQSAGVDVLIRDVYRTENQLFIRYTIENHSGGLYRSGTPRVLALRSPRCSRSLVSLANSQLGQEYQSHLWADGGDPVPVVQAADPAAAVDPGTSGAGVIVVQLPKQMDRANGFPTVLQMEFPADGARPVVATLVL
ncbi:MAG TPA: TrbG/VirB9 family P-type conjugative transfer protein [Terriglobales bacterium]|nr:TrbG/VirB9 family P-type conjugative transfer protein [Terriglobales bacterium]